MILKVIYILSIIISTIAATLNIRAIVDQYLTSDTISINKDNWLTPIYIFLIIFNALQLLK